ncbi:MAG: hypothetical protein KBH29_07370 [Lutibacter sp.]|nr:hypothetical protein [Lutibacter sp.]
MKIPKSVLLFFVIMLLQGCTKDVDFNQIDDASIQTSYKTSLIYLDLAPIKFLDNFNQEIVLTSDKVVAEIDDASRGYLEKVEFTIVTENSFNRSFLITINFLDEKDETIYMLNPTIEIPANSGETTINIKIPPSEIDVIYQTRYFNFDIVMHKRADGTQLSQTDDYKLNLKSSVELFFNFRKL